MKTENSRITPHTIPSEETVRLQHYYGDRSISKKAGPFVVLLQASLPWAEDIEQYHGAPAVFVVGGGKNFAKLVDSASNAPLELDVRVFYGPVDYPLVGAFITFPRVTIGFLMDPFTPKGRQVVKNWHEAKTLVIGFCQADKLVDCIDMPCPTEVSALLACPTPESYSDKVPLPVAMLASAHQVMNLDKMVVIAAFDSEADYGSAHNAADASIFGMTTTVH